MQKLSPTTIPPIELSEFDDAHLGVSLCSTTAVELNVYDYEKCIDILSQTNGITYREQAEELFQEKYLQEYFECDTPIFLKLNNS